MVINNAISGFHGKPIWNARLRSITFRRAHGSSSFGFWRWSNGRIPHRKWINRRYAFNSVRNYNSSYAYKLSLLFWPFTRSISWVFWTNSPCCSSRRLIYWLEWPERLWSTLDYRISISLQRWKSLQPVPTHDYRLASGMHCWFGTRTRSNVFCFIKFHREKIVPPDPITPSEKRQTLQRLNQVIQHRLVTGNLLPQMRRFRISNGCVKFTVDNEFEVTLTVMGDGPTVPWRLLDIEILVEDKETGDGKALVHTLQVNYIHQVIQARLVENTNALTEVYNCLHYFCQSLQLEVIYTQTLRLMIDRLDENIHVDEYLPGSKLTVSYWRELTVRDPKSELGYKLTIMPDLNDTARPLTVSHSPPIGSRETVEVAERSVRSEHLSMERLLVHTVYIRSLARLTDVKSEFQLFLKDVDCKW